MLINYSANIYKHTKKTPKKIKKKTEKIQRRKRTGNTLKKKDKSETFLTKRNKQYALK